MPRRPDDPQPLDLTDDDLIRLYRDGQADAFDALFDRYHVAVFNFACVMLRDRCSAEEILQETFLAVARTARSYDPRGQFRTWLMRIVRNRCLNRIEAQRARREVLSRDPEGLAIDPPSREPSPAECALASERMQLLRRALGQLPERQREAIALYAFEQMAYRQIAEVLDLPINTVKTLIHRARATLAENLAGWDMP